MMKIILILLIFSSSALARQTPRPESLVDLLTPEELKMHNCIKKLDKKNANFYAKANECLKGSNYYQTRTPSSSEYEMQQEMIEKHNWFFGSDNNMLAFFNFIKKLYDVRKKIKSGFKKLTHGVGGGINGSAYYGVGINWLAEFMIHEGKLGIYCAPGFGVSPSVGAEIGLHFAKSLACKNNKHYEGGFLTATGGLNFSVTGFPVGVYANYSLGVDLKNWGKNLKEAHKKGAIDFIEMAREVKVLDPIITSATYSGQNSIIPLYFGFKAMKLLKQAAKIDTYIPDTALGDKLPVTQNFLTTQLKGNGSLGKVFKKSLHLLNEMFDKYNTPNIKMFFQLLNNNISGCDAWGGSASIKPEASAGVVLSGSLAYYNYHLLMELTEEKILKYGAKSAFALLNPFFMTTTALADITTLAVPIISFGSNVKKYCGHQNVFF